MNILKKVFNKTKSVLSSVRNFYKRGNRLLRFFKYFSSVILFLLIITAISAEYTSRPSFCPTCHYMETFYQSWRTSSHNKVDCVECHFEPGISGTIHGKLNGLVQIVNYLSMAYKKRIPWADIPDNTCTRSGCHEKQAFQDSTYEFKGVKFNHKNHLQELKRGKTLKCTSCHSQIVQGTHIEVTANTCFNCHFKKSDDPDHKYDKLSQCQTCHEMKKMTEEQMTNLRYNHTAVVKNDIPCNSCHTNTVVGDGLAAKERCFQCHFENERLDKFNDVEFMHKTHITKHSMKCFTCHSQIDHRVQTLDPKSPPDCISCHESAHMPQVNLFTGQNGYNIEKMPSIMYMNGINCKGCHIFHEQDTKDVTTFKSGESSCEKCHGKGYDNLVKQWETASTKRVAVINSIYNTVSFQVKNSSSSRKNEAIELLNQAHHNIRIVEIGKSVHNVQFADKLLTAAYDLMKNASTVIGSSAKLPSFESSAEFIPNECYSCHSGIQEIAVKKYGMKFSHNQHIVKERIACAKCHSNANKHGELIVSKQNCNSCHHSKGKNNDACESCHKFQSLVYNGGFLNRHQKDIMKEGGVGCIDCHILSDKVYKPESSICLKCHESGYDDQMIDWKKDINKLLIELNSLLDKAKNGDLSKDESEEINEIRKISQQISSYPSIYVHNYDLISSVLSEKIKILKKHSE